MKRISKVLVINPPRVDGSPVVREERYEHKDVGSVYPPLNLLYCASVLEQAGYNVSVIDANGFALSPSDIKKKLKQQKPEIVISRCGFDTQSQDLEVLKTAKEYGATIILRNKIISDVQELKNELLLNNSFIDIFVDGEFESVIVNLLKVLETNGNLNQVAGITFRDGNAITSTEKVELVKNLDDLPFPAYHLLPNLEPYHTGILPAPFTLITTSRGCPFECTFCAYGKTKFRVRNPKKVVEEIKWLKQNYGLRSFSFFDDLVALTAEPFKEICRLLISEKLGLKWVACTRANLVAPELIRLMKKAGCVEMALGVESGSDEILKRVRKGITKDDIRSAVKILRKEKMLFYAMFIVGLPGETRETIEESINFAKEINPFYTQFCLAVPFPSTEMFQYYDKNGLLLTKDWSKFSPLASEPVIQTKCLSKEDLIELRQYAYKQMLFRPKYLFSQIRPFDWKWNISGAIKIAGRIMSLLRKKEIR